MLSEVEIENQIIPQRQFKQAQLITEQTWNSISNIAENIDQALSENTPEIMIKSELTFLSLADTDLSDDQKLLDLKSQAQSLMERLKADFAPNSRIQVKKRQGIYKLEWKAKDGEKISFIATAQKDRLYVSTPDTKSWDELQNYLYGLYKAVNATGLQSDQYDENGIPIGTGQGNKFTISGNSPEDSPFLSRPDLLMSLVTYWQNHPCLSYLFSGKQIGPMGFAPRIDEVRKDIIYELEIISKYIPLPGRGELHPELIDHMFRHILTNSSGQMSGAEISIEKLFPVEIPENQLGILQLQCFEMVPDPKLLLLQHLLVRAIVARCLQSPYHEKFINWGTSLQNEFMLPYFIELDFKDLLMDLKDYGFDFEYHWFAAQFARRFPQLGRVTLDDVELELTMALEPQNIYVDKACPPEACPPDFKRLQLKTKNLDPTKHAVTCNGFLVPLTEPDSHSIQVAAIRLYKNIPELPSKSIIKRTPNQLTFELVEKETRVSLGGFIFKFPTSEEYRGIKYTSDPVEARERRMSTFDPFIPYGGEIFINPAPKSLDMPHMLDLRKV